MSVDLDQQIAEWRTAILRSRVIDGPDADELESHLREQVADLEGVGLSGEEAFLIAVKRLGQTDALTAEYAREHSDRLWRQLAIAAPREAARHPLPVMLVFAALAAVIIQVARVAATMPGTNGEWFFRDLSLFVLPVLAGYFAIQRRMPVRASLALLAIVAVLGVAVNVFPFDQVSSVSTLIAIHLPIALWFVVGVAYVGGEIGSSARRMDFIRFTGEWIIYYALIALGGAVLMVLTGLILSPIAPDVINEVLVWVVPSGAAAAVIVAAWLVEAKKSVIENLAPVLTAIFTPLFAIMLVIAAVVYLAFGIGLDFDRDLLTAFDVLLLVVLGLVVYGISARDSSRSVGAMDVLRFVAVVAAIVVDVLVLVSMLTRVGEYGFTANRVAALGLNVLLLVNLAVTAWLLARVVWARQPIGTVERWQTAYLPVFAAWVAFVILALPPLFGFA
ncbi:hypothetical protein BH10ACT7_BH10ACT7_03660 [soil metagenome]